MEEERSARGSKVAAFKQKREKQDRVISLPREEEKEKKKRKEMQLLSRNREIPQRLKYFGKNNNGAIPLLIG